MPPSKSPQPSTLDSCWRQNYNQVRSPSAIRDQVPEQFAANWPGPGHRLLWNDIDVHCRYHLPPEAAAERQQQQGQLARNENRLHSRQPAAPGGGWLDRGPSLEAADFQGCPKAGLERPPKLFPPLGMAHGLTPGDGCRFGAEGNGIRRQGFVLEVAAIRSPNPGKSKANASSIIPSTPSARV